MSDPARPDVKYTVHGIPVSVEYFRLQVDLAFQSNLGAVEAAARVQFVGYSVRHNGRYINYGFDELTARSAAREFGDNTLIRNWLVNDWFSFRPSTPTPQNSSSGDKFTAGTNPQKDPFRLSKCLQRLLAPYFRAAGEFRGLDLNKIDIYEGLPENITQFAVIDVAGITLANSIYFAPGQYSANLDGIELVAHELTHIKQWRLKGQIGFVSAYLSEYRKNRKAGMSEVDAYANISFEKQAAEYAANIKEAIRKRYGENPCEKYKP